MCVHATNCIIHAADSSKHNIALDNSNQNSYRVLGGFRIIIGIYRISLFVHDILQLLFWNQSKKNILSLHHGSFIGQENRKINI